MSDRNKNGHSSKPANTDNESTMYIPSGQPGQQPPQNGQLPRKYYGQSQQSGLRYDQQPQHGGQQYYQQPQQGGQQYYQQPQQGGQQYYQQPQQGGQQYYQQPQQGGQQYYQQPQQGGQQYYQQPQQGGQQYYQQPQQGGQYYGQPQQGRPQAPNQRPAQQGRPRPQQQRPQQPRPQRPRPEAPRRKKKHHKSILGKVIRRVILSLLTLLILLFGIYSCVSLGVIKKMNYVPDSGRNRTAGALSAPYVRSVLLIGTDGRSLNEQGRSDTMILLSLNSSTNELSMTSFMRDCYVEIPGYGMDKLNAAYSYGGATLLMDTIERNFNVQIDDYVSINFLSFASIVDSVGGIDVDVSDAEAGEINTILQAEVNEIMGDAVDSDLLSSGGKLHLSGKQALSYARIRYIGNADFERTQRQREVIGKVLDKVKTLKPSILSNIAKNVMPQVTTNMDTIQLYVLSLRLPFAARYDRVQLQIPAEGTYHGESTNAGDALVLDFDQNYDIISEKVFGQ